MNYKRPMVDIVSIGLGWSCPVMTAKLTRAGLKAVAIERNTWCDTLTNFPTIRDPDKLGCSVSKDILNTPETETYVLHNKNMQTISMRDYRSKTLNNNVGGRSPCPRTVCSISSYGTPEAQ
ncbi:hypothetical protein MSKU15_0112 [Komagataeibacter diospyri]|nr:hypothetical protein MSKU15_0112 [Komagataeibacter diospyri]